MRFHPVFLLTLGASVRAQTAPDSSPVCTALRDAFSAPRSDGKSCCEGSVSVDEITCDNSELEAIKTAIPLLPSIPKTTMRNFYGGLVPNRYVQWRAQYYGYQRFAGYMTFSSAENQYNWPAEYGQTSTNTFPFIGGGTIPASLPTWWSGSDGQWYYQPTKTTPSYMEVALGWLGSTLPTTLNAASNAISSHADLIADVGGLKGVQLLSEALTTLMSTETFGAVPLLNDPADVPTAVSSEAAHVEAIRLCDAAIEQLSTVAGDRIEPLAPRHHLSKASALDDVLGGVVKGWKGVANVVKLRAALRAYQYATDDAVKAQLKDVVKGAIDSGVLFDRFEFEYSGFDNAKGVKGVDSNGGLALDVSEVASAVQYKGYEWYAGGLGAVWGFGKQRENIGAAQAWAPINAVLVDHLSGDPRLSKIAQPAATGEFYLTEKEFEHLTLPQSVRDGATHVFRVEIVGAASARDAFVDGLSGTAKRFPMDDTRETVVVESVQSKTQFVADATAVSESAGVQLVPDDEIVGFPTQTVAFPCDASAPGDCKGHPTIRHTYSNMMYKVTIPENTYIGAPHRFAHPLQTTTYYMLSRPTQDFVQEKVAYPVVTVVESYLLLAEAMLKGIVTNADVFVPPRSWQSPKPIEYALEMAIKASYDFWGVDLATNPPKQHPAYVSFTTTTDVQAKLDIVYLQKWLGLFPDGLTAWASVRNTGIPSEVFEIASTDDFANVLGFYGESDASARVPCRQPYKHFSTSTTIPFTPPADAVDTYTSMCPSWVWDGTSPRTMEA